MMSLVMMAIGTVGDTVCDPEYWRHCEEITVVVVSSSMITCWRTYHLMQ